MQIVSFCSRPKLSQLLVPFDGNFNEFKNLYLYYHMKRSNVIYNYYDYAYKRFR